ncbi:MAG: PCRF domain-containing protein [Coleofasciculus sp. C1-SOL-03]|uniref:PCRF domain-containing protein n=1 Tax=Coleofasciculus sp. C1-SOL-03 TaxID=3069522 RepID=UPI0032F7D3D9
MQYLEQVATQPDLSNRSPSYQEALQQLSNYRLQLQHFEQWQVSWQDLQAASLLLEQETDEELLQESQVLIAQLNRELEKWEIQQLLSDPCDQKGAFLIIEAKSRDKNFQFWVIEIVRMYVQWAENYGYRIRLIDVIQGDYRIIYPVAHQGIDIIDIIQRDYGENARNCHESFTLEIFGRYAYGYLKAEKGEHSLRYNSLFLTGEEQYISSVTVEVIPLLDEDGEIDIPQKHLQITIPSKVRCLRITGVISRCVLVQILHVPTGIVVCSSQERSQLQNREKALILLKSKLLAIAQAQGVGDISNIRCDLITGVSEVPNVRDYLCTKFSESQCLEGIVRDCRTGVETTSIDDVMNGKLAPFIHAYLQSALD